MHRTKITPMLSHAGVAHRASCKEFAALAHATQGYADLVGRLWGTPVLHGKTVRKWSYGVRYARRRSYVVHMEDWLVSGVKYGFDIPANDARKYKSGSFARGRR